jgi:hypothetical protein
MPERRTDKNGVTSTKWIKPVGKPVTRSFAPPPALNDIAARKEIIGKLANEMHDTVYGEDAPDIESLRDIEASLSKYTNATLRKIRRFYDDHSTGFRYHGGEHHVLASMVESGANGETATDLMKYLVDDLAHDSIIAYSHYRQRGWIDWDIQGKDDPRLEALESTAGNIEKAVRLGKPPVAKRAGGAEELWDIPVIKDERLFRLVLDRIEDNDRIVDIIKSGKVDYDLIVAELDAPVQALSKGHL